jgi:hypothetical protein
MSKWTFIPNYLGRACVAGENNSIVLDTRTLDPKVAKACELLVEAHNLDVDQLMLPPPALTAQQLTAIRYAIKLTEAQAKAMKKKGLPAVDDYFDEQIRHLSSILPPITAGDLT